MEFDLGYLLQQLPALRAGLLLTVEASGIAILLSLALGLLGASALGAALVALARAHDVPVAFDGNGWAACVVAVMLLTLLSALAALRGLRRADPALLLR